MLLLLFWQIFCSLLTAWIVVGCAPIILLHLGLPPLVIFACSLSGAESLGCGRFLVEGAGVLRFRNSKVCAGGLRLGA